MLLGDGASPPYRQRENFFPNVAAAAHQARLIGVKRDPLSLGPSFMT